MALFKTRSAAVYGIDAYPVDVEVDLYKSGMAKDFTLVGMPDTAVRFRMLRARVARAYREAGAQAVDGFRKVMLGIISSPADRARFDRTGPTARRR